MGIWKKEGRKAGKVDKNVGMERDGLKEGYKE